MQAVAFNMAAMEGEVMEEGPMRRCRGRIF
jgi:hypothetical protein